MPSDNAPFELFRLDDDSTRPSFTSADKDIDEFFHEDSIVGARELMCVTYLWHESDRLKAFFAVSNDSIKREECPRSAFERIAKLVRGKRYSSMPAVKIGRLGVHVDFKRTGVGSRILDYLKIWFTVGNKTGCRFLVVDAYNKSDVLAFYESNGFQFLTGSDKDEETRIMYFDLIQFARRSLA